MVKSDQNFQIKFASHCQPNSLEIFWSDLLRTTRSGQFLLDFGVQLAWHVNAAFGNGSIRFIFGIYCSYFVVTHHSFVPIPIRTFPSLSNLHSSVRSKSNQIPSRIWTGTIGVEQFPVMWCLSHITVTQCDASIYWNIGFVGSTL